MVSVWYEAKRIVTKISCYSECMKVSHLNEELSSSLVMNFVEAQFEL